MCLLTVHMIIPLTTAAAAAAAAIGPYAVRGMAEKTETSRFHCSTVTPESQITEKGLW